MDIPTYLRSDDFKEQNTFMEEMFQTLLQGLGPTGFAITQQTTANITQLIARTTTPVLPVGVTWFNTDISKLQVLVTAAVFGVSDGIIETVTSV